MTTYSIRQAAVGALALTIGLTAACSDTPSAPNAALAPSEAPAFNPVSSTLSQTTIGDTVVTVFVVGTNTKTAATFEIGHTSKIDFPYSASSICDLATSSYGAGTWNQKCTASTKPVTITARVWKNAAGKVVTDFQPAMRFVPGLRLPVALYLRDRDQKYAAGQQALYCFTAGCIDESVADPSLTTTYDATNGLWKRPIKHFSGYTMSVGRDEAY